MKTLQLEHAAWIAEKYPGQMPKIPAVGCLEEAGELVHAILKIEQVRLWGEDSRHRVAELRVKLVDAVGDCGIFACSLCNANEWDFAEAWTAEGAVVRRSDALDAAIVLVQLAADIALEPMDCERLYNYIGQLKYVAHCFGLDAEAAVRATWLEVKCR